MKNKTLLIIAFILNIIILPGLGNLLGGETHKGLLQMLIAAIGIGVAIVLQPLGIIIVVVALVWSLKTGIAILKKA